MMVHCRSLHGIADPMAVWSSEMPIEQDGTMDSSFLSASTRTMDSSFLSASTRTSQVTASRRSRRRADEVRQKHANMQEIRQVMKSFHNELAEKNSPGIENDVSNLKASLAAMELLMKDLNYRQNGGKLRQKCRRSSIA